MALRRLPAFVSEYLEGGAEDEVTLTANRAAFEARHFVPRVLAGHDLGAATDLFDSALSVPLIVAPTGFNGLFWHNGDLALAKAAAAAGIPFTQSTVSNASIEQVTAIDGLNHWMQLYYYRDTGGMASLVSRAITQGSTALVVTVDGSAIGNREWDRRLYRANGTLRWLPRMDALAHPRWMIGVYARGIPGFVNLYDCLQPDQHNLMASTQWARGRLETRLSWSEVEHLRKRWPRKLIIKGVAHGDDIARALSMGADGVVISNHGGRQLDGTLASLDLLRRARDRLGDKPVLLVDGGIRRGSDILKAILSGATAVMAGRAMLYGLAAGGEVGAARAIAILKEEFSRASILNAGGDLVTSLSVTRRTGELLLDNSWNTAK